MCTVTLYAVKKYNMHDVSEVLLPLKECGRKLGCLGSKDQLPQ